MVFIWQTYPVHPIILSHQGPVLVAERPSASLLNNTATAETQGRRVEFPRASAPLR